MMKNTRTGIRMSRVRKKMVPSLYLLGLKDTGDGEVVTASSTDTSSVRSRKTKVYTHNSEIRVVQNYYSRTCFERPLTFSTKIGRKRKVALQKTGKINIKSMELYKN